MNNRAIYYITRKKKRSLIILIVVTIIFSSLYVSLNVIKSTTHLKNSISRTAQTSLSISKKDQSSFDHKAFKETKNYILQYNGIIKPKQIKVIEAMQSIKRDDLPEEYQNVLSYQAINQTENHALFKSGNFILEKGRHLKKKDLNKVMIHERLAKKNHLKIGNYITLQNNRRYKIIGIFSGKKQEAYTGLTSDFSENMIFIDYRSLHTKNVNQIIMFFNSSQEAQMTMNHLRQKYIDYDIEEDRQTYKETLEVINYIQYIIKLIENSFIVVAIVVLSLILILWLRERIHEIGILLSIGISKIEILGQFIIELLLISLPAVILSIAVGNVLFKFIINELLKREYSLLVTNGIEQELSVFLASYGILVTVILLSVVIACGMFLTKKPKEILSEMS